MKNDVHSVSQPTPLPPLDWLQLHLQLAWSASTLMAPKGKTPLLVFTVQLHCAEEGNNQLLHTYPALETGWK